MVGRDVEVGQRSLIGLGGSVRSRILTGFKRLQRFNEFKRLIHNYKTKPQTTNNLKPIQLIKPIKLRKA